MQDDSPLEKDFQDNNLNAKLQLSILRKRDFSNAHKKTLGNLLYKGDDPTHVSSQNIILDSKPTFHSKFSSNHFPSSPSP